MARKEKKRPRISEQDLLALGGSKADLTLLEGVDEQENHPVITETTVNKDPSLSTDVSKFLDDLKLESRPAPKGKEKESSAKSNIGRHPKFSKLAQHDSSSAKPNMASSSRNSAFTFRPISQWHAALPLLGPPTDPIKPAQLSALSEKCARLHEKDILTYHQQTSSNSQTGNPASSEANFLSNIIHSGTLSDRLSALTLLVQNSPLHNLKALETLKGMAERGKGKGGREESLKALRCIVDWWVGGGAPDRKFKYFRDQPLLHPDVTDEYLLLWYFEDWLKKYFFSILHVLETLSLDPLPYIRTQTITLIFTLLRDKPEQEQNLLRLLVNKLGDSEKSLCSRASYHILQLLQTHPSMKTVVVREIMALMHKPSVAATTGSITGTQQHKHVRFADSKDTTRKSGEKDKSGGNPHAKYYAAVTFNQIVLTPSDKSVAFVLLDIYFKMFKAILGEKSRGDNEDGGAEKEEEGHTTGDGEVKIDKAGRVMDFKKRSKGKTLNHSKGAAGFTEVEDTDSKLISAILTGINRALPFAHMDANSSVLNEHIDTLFFITHTSTFNISLQALLLIQQISTSLSSSQKSNLNSALAKSVTDRYYRTLYDSLHDLRLASSSKQAMYLNLFFKSVKADENADRVKALIRRFTQVLVTGGSGATEFVAGGLYLLGELFSSVPGLKTILNTSPTDEGKYDARKRDPQYVHAGSSPLWELTPLLYHYHPAIALHARQLLLSQPLTASPDLSQNTLSHFLDRFVYKNPKKLKPKEGDPDGTRLGKGPSAMQPAASGVEGIKLIKGEAAAAASVEMVNGESFLRKRRENVPVDQIFFHEYFTRKHRREREKGDVGLNGDFDGISEKDGSLGGEGNPESDKDWGDEDVDSDAEEADIWKVMQTTMPKMDEDDDMMFDSEEDKEDTFDDIELRDSDEDNTEEELLSLAEASDDEDLVPLEGLIEYDGSDDAGGGGGGSDSENEEAEWSGIGVSGVVKKRKRVMGDDKERKKKLRSLPTFASYEDYARLIEEGPEDDI